ncbi:MAG: DUF3141 domain-containing protein [Gammaproteobacteria bacterium]
MDLVKKTIRHTSAMMTLWAKLAAINLKQLNHSYQTLLDLQQKEFDLFSLNLPLLTTSALEYGIDYAQRLIIFWDILRLRGNQYLEHIASGQPPVLIFKYKMILDGRTFKHPVNYGLVKIRPPKGVVIDNTKRPYVIIDPRAGHGSGIGGFKDDSQVGIALKAGHPVYFVIFFPEPEPGQNLHDITLAEEKFLRKVAKRHPNSPKPCLIGNCQGGWAAMALAAAHPDVAGVTVINGAPLAYWAGENGKNPMRFAGGILGGSWLAQLAGDLGNGKFDGAHLILNFEALNPANALWKKYYNLFANLDHEENHFLKFERWWGGFSLMNTKEMRSIVDNLFIGNKLAHGKVSLDRNSHIDLRNNNLPLIIFCSDGDNITPPQQALNWIADIYPDILGLKLAGKVIVYLVHQSVGHLGIFVSGSIAKKEHRQIVDLLNYVEHLPPGLYEMIIGQDPDTQEPRYSVKLEERTIEHIHELGHPAQKREKALFNIATAISDFNATAYDFLISPFMRLWMNESLAEWLRELHPLRTSRYLISDSNPLITVLTMLAPAIRKNRQPTSPDNPFLAIQGATSEMINASVDTLKEIRDSSAELLFYAFYGVLDLFLPEDLPFRENLAESSAKTDDKELDQHIIATLEGDVPEAIIRILLLLIRAEGFTHGAHFSRGIEKLRQSGPFQTLSQADLRHIVNVQTVIIEYDSKLAIKTLPRLLKTTEAREQALFTVHNVLTALESPVPEKAQKMLNKISDLLQA